MPPRGVGGTGGRSIAPGSIKGLHVADLAFERYLKVVASSQQVPDDAALGMVTDGLFGPMWTAAGGFGVATAGAGDNNYQMIPAWPVPTSAKFRNISALAVARGFSSFGSGFTIQPSMATGETIEVVFGAGKQQFRVCDPASTRATHRPMGIRLRLKNATAFGAGDSFYVGYGKIGVPATFEAYTDFAGFKLVKGAGTEADIFTVTRQASGTVSQLDTGKEALVNAVAALGHVELEIQIRGRKGSIEVKFYVNGANVRTVRLTTLAAGTYQPVMFFTAATAAWASVQISRLEMGALEAMERE